MKKILSVIIILCFLIVSVQTSTAEAPYGDTESSALEILLQKGIVEGYDDGQLYHEKILTRAQFAKILSLAFPDITTTEIFYEFEDLDSTHWAINYIQKALNAGWLKGYPDNTVRPDENITYEQAVTVLCRILELAPYYDTLSYPEDYIEIGIEHSITDNINALIGEDINRAQAAQMICNALNYEQGQLENSYSAYPAVGMKSISLSAISYDGASAAYAGGAENERVIYSEAPGLYEPIMPPANKEQYSANEENVFKDVTTSPLSTFSIDTDTASYSNMRRFILNGSEIPYGAIRSEELINYFDYTKAEIEEGKPFGVNYTVSRCPWNDDNMLAMLTVSGEELSHPKPSNIVFLIDISGSMYSYNKLPLVKQALSMLLDKLGVEDKISIVTYASGTQVLLEPTSAEKKETILNVINGLNAHGATYGESGIKMAYKQAEKYKRDGNNRIILCTDGDFNIGASSDSELEKLISEKRNSGIFLSVLGFGMGNYKDSKMEILADKGNGNYAYIDNLREAKKVLADEMQKTIYTIAKDVKIQTEFNPEIVSQYRLIGYENRMLNNEDFDNDKKDAGELGAGATVTVLYEIVPHKGQAVSNLKYQTINTTGSNELMNVKIRYKLPDSDESILSEYPVLSELSEASQDFNFACAVAELGMILNDSEYKGNSTYDTVIELARSAIGKDVFGIRSEFVQLVDLLRYKNK